MKLFKLDSGYGVIPEKDTIMLIPEFYALWTLKYNKMTGDRKGFERRKGVREIVYLYFYCDYRSEFSELDNNDKHQAALDAAGLPDNYRFTEELDKAVVKYLQMQETRELKLLNSAYNVIDKLREMMDGIEIIDEENQRSAIESVVKIGALLKGVKELEKQVRKQEGERGSIRGDAEEGFLK